ncbi:hypothetical protein OG204_23865 [Streptomyces sp. NBC_01387]|uniref:hypothetical protein n=1 Tax=unclassified Streptomyces TaxID=2593676 RepID=UPI0020254349|nr:MULTISPECIES: hypothetical protein [unclassified Streptomyces]MCX4548640.1 hypothetical protein [Streptomyces sp. NBC_01500]WSC20246.1 hypothetical protein OIE60_11415 [Streptomyces sp. NBC_01766]WSV54270.1 hypothetical protein OG282_11395 [Streptomyces sp. NBC_01014]
MARRPVAFVAALVLFLEAFGVAFVNLILGKVADNQHMSMAGVDPSAISTGAWVAGGVFGLYLLLCAFFLLRTGLTDRPAGRFGRVLLITCAVVHGVLGALTWALVGWPAFVFMVVVLGLLVLTLLAYDKERPVSANGAPAAA